MKEKLTKLLVNIFGVFVSISILGGVLVFAAYVIGFIIGGDSGTALMATAYSKWVPYFIKSATIAVMMGLVVFYVTGKHTLSLKEKN